MLLNVLTDLSADTGLDIVQKRPLLLRILNRAAKEMHKELECNKVYREATLAVPPDKIVSLPSFIGELRGMRMHTNELPFNLDAMTMPRYKNTTLQHKFKNWRDLGEAATYVYPEQGKLTLTCPSVETTSAEVVIKGQTANANSIEETVIMSATSKETVALFGPRIDSIFCSTERLADITIKDYLGTEIATLYNNFQTTRYKIVDVSQVFWTLDTTDGQSLIDVLYKVPAHSLLNDGDSFYAGDDYDEAWYNMSMFFFLKPLQNRQSDAQAHRAVCMNFLTSAKESSEQGIMKRLIYGRNKFYGLFRKYRYYPGSVTNVDHNIQA